jgi:hypothetical protein
VELHTKFRPIYFEERSYLGGVGIHVKITLVWIFGLVEVPGFCEHRNGIS